MRPDQITATQYLAGPAPARAPTIRTATMRQSLGAHFVAAASWIGRQMERRRSRRALLEMTDDQLKDIGLSRGEAYSESVRRLWD
ncbi:DUF1127 domain-containing protein [Mesorhizobium sp. M7D.F.Ca.US.005.01.1.1]|uniref:DUF1127 domain-containing protein n=1 Tax=Mesorhizobium sp. M7D.F.Ca.US.005.01.1.1 TaxID=2493678 RepID=UPI000F758FA6|nr:DUF1127 domain-containing protein [Mesorhizobium sp. M7D.F.Ca.US.005.01.1.1]AZO45130.1 DUF1127 domain-containing protein [Mesorhizobium sp. M7D.F.Ca.US.005.01.1.1]